MTPDPAGMAAADPANPQSWNRYAYVMNNPLNATDPLGLYCYPGDGPSFSTGERDMQHECGRCNPITDASCSGDGPSHDDPAGTPDSVLGESIAQNTTDAANAFNARVGRAFGGCVNFKDGSALCRVFFPVPNDGSGGSWLGTFVKSFVTNFSVFGPSNDSRPSCFAGFINDTGKNLVGIPGVDTTGAAATAYYGTSRRYFTNAVPNTRIARGGISPNQWLAADEATRASTSINFGILLNLVIAEGQALGGEISAARSGECK